VFGGLYKACPRLAYRVCLGLSASFCNAFDDNDSVVPSGNKPHEDICGPNIKTEKQ
jgi:hypothetical protein